MAEANKAFGPHATERGATSGSGQATSGTPVTSQPAFFFVDYLRRPSPWPGAFPLDRVKYSASPPTLTRAKNHHHRAHSFYSGCVHKMGEVTWRRPVTERDAQEL